MLLEIVIVFSLIAFWGWMLDDLHLNVSSYRAVKTLVLYENKSVNHVRELRGVFKKKPKFLNSAPSNTESALRLMSAPSVRFWQQTVICPVSLWALVVEVHPLNWPRAQAVHRIERALYDLALLCVRSKPSIGSSFWASSSHLGLILGGSRGFPQLTIWLCNFCVCNAGNSQWQSVPFLCKLLCHLNPHALANIHCWLQAYTERTFSREKCSIP
jgi:hypothetical protein